MESNSKKIDEDELLKVNGGRDIYVEYNANDGDRLYEQDDDEDKPHDFVPSYHGMIIIQSP